MRSGREKARSPKMAVSDEVWVEVTGYKLQVSAT